jgi:hypothetical protein
MSTQSNSTDENCLYQFTVKLHRIEAKSLIRKGFQTPEFMELHTKLVLTETSVEQFIDFIKFIGNNNLWNEVAQHLKAEGIANIVVSSEPIASVRRLITDKLLKSDCLDRQAHAQAIVISRCGCGVSLPGPPRPQAPQSPGGDGGTDAG